MMLSVYDTGASSGAFNMAADEYALKQVPNSALRFYRWDPIAVSFGRFQSIGAINVRGCTSHGIDIVRRMTGGKIVLHKNDLSYSIALEVSELPLKVEQSYSAITNSLCYAFRKLGLDAEVYTSVNAISAESAMCGKDRMYGDILIRDKKVAGSAQARHKNRVLHHGSINIDLDTIDPAFFLSIIDAYQSVPTEANGTTSLNKELKGRIQLDILQNLIIEGFAINFGMNWKAALFSETELGEIKHLYVPKYRSQEWTNRI